MYTIINCLYCNISNDVYMESPHMRFTCHKCGSYFNYKTSNNDTITELINYHIKLFDGKFHIDGVKAINLTVFSNESLMGTTGITGPMWIPGNSSQNVFQYGISQPPSPPPPAPPKISPNQNITSSATGYVSSSATGYISALPNIPQPQPPPPQRARFSIEKLTFPYQEFKTTEEVNSFIDRAFKLLPFS